jgi:hypothetical protein
MNAIAQMDSERSILPFEGSATTSRTMGSGGRVLGAPLRRRASRTSRGWPWRRCLVRLASCIALALVSGCGFHVGKPYNVDSVRQLVVGRATTHDARQLMGAPFKASPLRYTTSESDRLKLKCPDIAESWTYQYKSSSNACLTTLEFDTAGLLCSVADTPAKGPKCHGED